MIEELERRARQIRSRAAIRAWEYRQRRHANGTWFRFRRVLADAAEAYQVPPAVMDELVATGVRCEPVGMELEPPRRIVFLSRERTQQLPGRQRVALQLGPALLAARDLVLVAFAASEF